MRVIDLSHAICEGMPCFPGDEPPVFASAFTDEHDGFNEKLVTMLTHTGTHMDAPAHVFSGRATLDAFSPSQFIGRALVVDVRDHADGQPIILDNLASYGELASEADFLLFNTGWDKRWGTDAYFGNYPCLDDTVMDFVLAGDYKGIGFDVMGLDPIADEELSRHKKLFREKDIVNIENLCRLDECARAACGGLFSFSCFPLPLQDADGSPVRAVAWFED